MALYKAILKRSVSLDEAIRYLTEGVRSQNRISDLAGSWKVSEKEIIEIRRSLARSWAKWH